MTSPWLLAYRRRAPLRADPDPPPIAPPRRAPAHRGAPRPRAARRRAPRRPRRAGPAHLVAELGAPPGRRGVHRIARPGDRGRAPARARRLRLAVARRDRGRGPHRAVLRAAGLPRRDHRCRTRPAWSSATARSSSAAPGCAAMNDDLGAGHRGDDRSRRGPRASPRGARASPAPPSRRGVEPRAWAGAALLARQPAGGRRGDGGAPAAGRRGRADPQPRRAAAFPGLRGRRRPVPGRRGRAGPVGASFQLAEAFVSVCPLTLRAFGAALAGCAGVQAGAIHVGSVGLAGAERAGPGPLQRGAGGAGAPALRGASRGGRGAGARGPCPAIAVLVRGDGALRDGAGRGGLRSLPGGRVSLKRTRGPRHLGV